MFDDAAWYWALVAGLAAGVALLMWWQDHDGIRSSWGYHRRVRRRERLTGEEFCTRFYAGSGIRSDLVVAFRDFHAGFWGEDPALLRPEDNLFAVNAGADFAGWVAAARARFGVVVPERLTPELRAALPTAGPTFDVVLRYIHALRSQQDGP